MWTTLALALALSAPQTVPPPASGPERIAEIRVHGNHVSSDADVIALAGVTIGAQFEPTTIALVESRLKAAKRFDEVTVLKRFASIADPSQIVLVLIVNEGAVRIEIPIDDNDPVRIVKRRGFRNLMFMPIFDLEDGYGLTFGARVAHVGAAKRRSRLSFPLTWGGMRRAGAEIERSFTRGPLTRIEFGTAFQQQKNPGFDTDDRRLRAWVKGERTAGHARLSVTTGWQDVSFGTIDDELATIGGEAVFDTRIDPVLPRNAVYGAVGVEHVWFESGGSVNRLRLDGRVFVGLFGQTVLVARAVRYDADAPLPPYLKSLGGGWSSLRGFEAGSFIGDTMAVGSLELRVPLNSPVNLAKLGVSVFVDSGKIYDKGTRFADAKLETGAGASVWIAIAAFRLSVGVAHGVGASTRVNFGGGLTF